MGETHCEGGKLGLAPLSSTAQSCTTLCDPMDCSTPDLSVHHQLPELTQIHVLWWWCNPTISSSVIPFSSCLHSFSWHQGLFQWVSSLHHVVKVLELQLQHQSFQWIFRTDFLEDCLFDFLVVQGTKSLLQHYSSKSSVLWHSAFFMVQLSHPYTGKTIALTRQTFLGKVISLLFNMLSRLVITFLPRSKRLLISWLQSPSAVIWEPQKINSATVTTVPHLFAMKWWNQMPWS